MLFVGTSIIHPSTEGVFLLCNILDLLIYRLEITLKFEDVYRTEYVLKILRVIVTVYSVVKQLLFCC